MSRSRPFSLEDTVHITNRRQSNMKQNMMVDTYNIVVSERINFKKEEDGNTCQYFTVFANAGDDKVFPKVEKTYQDFKNLELAINNNLRSNDIECPALEKENSAIDISGWRESAEQDVPLTEKINNVKRFCRLLGADPALHCEPFYEFFKIPKVQVFYEGRGSEVDIVDKFKSTVVPGSMVTDGNWNDFEKENTSDYCPYFKVAVLGPPESKEDKGENSKGSHNYYSFVIKQIADLDKTLQIEKRYSAFYDLAVRMKSAVTARPPPLPPKLMLKDKHSLQKRGEALEEWLAFTLNEKVFFCSDLFNFIGLDEGTLSRYSQRDIIAILLESATFKFSLGDKKSQQSQEESFITFEIRVDIYDNTTKDLIDRYKVYRRFKEFDHLHNELKHKFQKNVKQLPDLPSKMAYLNILNVHNMDQRQEKLQIYLKQLVQYPGIFQTVSFRKFIALDTRKIELLMSNFKKRSQL